MKNVGYLIKRVCNMNYKQLWQKLGELHQKTGKSRLALFNDIRHCATAYGAGYMDYDLFEMYDMTEEQRATYVTRGRSNAFVKKYNNPEYIHFFNNKNEFNERFAEYIHRDWILANDENREEVLAFLQKHESFVLKPLDGKGGKGIEKHSVAALGGAEKAEEYVASAGEVLLEETLIQHPAVAGIYPDSVNTVRVVTINKNGEVHIIAACFRIGSGGKNVDNFSSGGMVALVDENTGVVKTVATNRKREIHANHPQTDVPILGFTFPDWEIAVEMVKKAAQEIPEVAYTGWDVAFAENGPCLIEGNSFPGHDLYQLPAHHPEKTGMMPKYDI